MTDVGVILYFNNHCWSDEIKMSLIEYIQHFVPGFGVKNFRVTRLTEHDWMSDWKKHFRPIRLGQRLIIKPPWEEYSAGQEDVIITINPKMAFGTGHHESTRLAVMEIERYIRPGINVLDVGTGSGILAIIACKLGAGSAFGLDIDPEAIKNAYENADHNQVNKGIQFGIAELDNITPFEYDLIVANINRNVLLGYAAQFPEYLQKGGQIILAGILRSDEGIITGTYQENGFRVIRRNILREWLCLVLEFKGRKIETGSY